MTLSSYLTALELLILKMKRGQRLVLSNPMDLIYAARQLANAQLDEVA